MIYFFEGSKIFLSSNVSGDSSSFGIFWGW